MDDGQASHMRNREREAQRVDDSRDDEQNVQGVDHELGWPGTLHDVFHGLDAFVGLCRVENGEGTSRRSNFSWRLCANRLRRVVEV